MSENHSMSAGLHPISVVLEYSTFDFKAKTSTTVARAESIVVSTLGVVVGIVEHDTFDKTPNTRQSSVAPRVTTASSESRCQ